MRIGSADYLRLLVRTGGHIEVDPEFPHGYRTRTLITIKAADAPDGLELKTPAVTASIKLNCQPMSSRTSYTPTLSADPSAWGAS